MLDNSKSQGKSQKITIIIGNLNVKVGKERDGKIVGKFGLRNLHQRGEKWVELCKDQVIATIWFLEHPRHIWTWESTGVETKNQIYFTTINKRFKNTVLHCKAYPSANCGSDHLQVICKLRV